MTNEAEPTMCTFGSRWFVKALGNAEGRITGATDVSLKAVCKEVPFEGTSAEICSNTGKLGDSEDSFLFWYTAIDPYKQNFSLSAVFTVNAEAEKPDYQTGYGIMAVDTIVSESLYARHRNQFMAGVFGRNHKAAVRIVTGYSAEDASEHSPVRRFDPTRLFSDAGSVESVFTSTHKIKVEKTDLGISAEFDGREIFVPGCDYLIRQCHDRFYIGFAVGGKLRMRLSDICFKVSEGKFSVTPAGILQHVLPDYPLPADSLDVFASYEGRSANARWFVSPEGSSAGEGSRENPYDLHSAIRMAGPGTEICLLDGRYILRDPCMIPFGWNGTESRPIVVQAEHEGRAVLDAFPVKRKLPAFVLCGDYWTIKGLVTVNASSSGILICGSHNVINRCIAAHNQDTGILICAYPRTERKRWPSFNVVKECVSHDNCDPVRCNADGFGAKLRIGKGNAFYKCRAHHNIDDGFDLYNKSVIGKVPSVKIENCTAFCNGFLNGEKPGKKGVGFKLGGENQDVPHKLLRSLAYGNGKYGISANSNPGGVVCECVSCCNGKGRKKDQIYMYTGEHPHWIVKKNCTFTVPWNDRMLLPLIALWKNRGILKWKDRKKNAYSNP